MKSIILIASRKIYKIYDRLYEKTDPKFKIFVMNDNNKNIILIWEDYIIQVIK